MAAEEKLVYWVFAAVFGLSTIAFALVRNRKPSDNLVYSSNVFVTFLTTISYVIMALSIATSIAGSGEPIYWSRWLFYAASCSMLTVDMAFIGKKTKIETFEIAFLTSVTMFCGFLASFVTVQERWWFFGLSTAAYLGMLYTLFLKRSEAVNSGLEWFVLVTWSAFPLVWVLAPTGFGVVTTYTEAILYGALDLLTKIFFGTYLIYRSIK
jgi:sensory rhodopsin